MNDLTFQEKQIQAQVSDFELVYPSDVGHANVHSLTDEVSNLHPLCAQILVMRGLDSFTKVKGFFNPDFSSIKNMSQMADANKATLRLADAIRNGEEIMLYGDYDVDGSCAVAVMYNVLKAIGGQLHPYQPDRYDEGYGLSEKGVRAASALGVKLMVTLDCGILAHEKIQLANELGIDVIVCDHHLPGIELPAAYAVMNPKRADCIFEGKELCGCGVAYMLLMSLQQSLLFPEALLLNELPLVAIATCCDIVPLTGINRILVEAGLKRLNSDMPAGVGALLRMAAHSGPMDVGDVVFKIGPRINAAGRLAHASIAVELLTAKDSDLIQQSAAELEKLNVQRKLLDKKITAEAISQMVDDDPQFAKSATVVYNKEWHKGVVGIIASRLTERCYRPTVVLTKANGVLTGSARSVEGFNLHAAIAACSETLLQFGGHDAAAGLTLKEEKFSEFSDRFEEAVASTLSGSNKIPKLQIDLVVQFKEWYNVNWHTFYKQMSRMKPYGPSNPEPVFATHSCKARGVQVVGSDHLKFMVYDPERTSETLSVIAFKQASKYDELSSGATFTLAYTIGESEWQGRRSLQLEAKAIELCR